LQRRVGYSFSFLRNAHGAKLIVPSEPDDISPIGSYPVPMFSKNSPCVH
jgi:hypothetical protein